MNDTRISLSNILKEIKKELMSYLAIGTLKNDVRQKKTVISIQSVESVLLFISKFTVLGTWINRIIKEFVQDFTCRSLVHYITIS